jgi:hypothetical protein
MRLLKPEHFSNRPRDCESDEEMVLLEICERYRV